MDFSNLRKRLREERLRGVVLERVQNHGGFRSGVHHSGHDIICHNRRHGPRELGWCRHLPTPYYGSTDDLSGPWDPCPPSPHAEGLPLPATSPQGVESTLPAPAAEGTTEYPDNPPPDASAAMEVVEEVLTSTAAGGQHPKGSPLYGERLSPYTVSRGHTYQPQKERKEEADQEATPGYCIGGHGCQPPPTFRQGPYCSAHHKEAQQCSGESPQTQRASRWSLPEVPDAVPGTLLLLRPSRSTLPLWAEFSSSRRPREVLSVDPHA
ncbi:hypothetical protein MRX96_022022 [Rhipicephalus microplus]